MAERVIFDCSLFLQAVTSERGPAFKCFDLVERGQLILFLSPAIIDEVQDVLSRPVLRAKFPILTPDRAATFIEKFKRISVMTPEPPHVFALPRDPDDEPYTDLAIAVAARFLVTWNDRHLTYLMRQDTPEGQDFCRKYPTLSILPPPDFIRHLSTP